MGYAVAGHDVIQNGSHLGFFKKIKISQNGVEISRNVTECANTPKKD